ncbi:helix-turn-helix domain-containing protein, partial [Priestia megaterium]|uniref:helix-turn-helix domain-containing protein n=1 Tax=Priestia megaterium TaxID=1404 RepID=UPI002FFFA678
MELRKYESFKSVKEMDKHVQAVIELVNLKKNEVNLLLLLSRYSCKFVGCSFLKVDTMASQLEISSRTVRRALKRLEQLGIIKRLKRIREVTGGNSSNLVIILNSQPVLSECEEVANPTDTRFQDEKEAKETLSNLNKKSLEKNTYEPDASYLQGTNIPSYFIDLASSYFSDYKDILKLWN